MLRYKRDDLGKTLAMIHTSPVLTGTFDAMARERLNGSPWFHMVDESLIRNTIREGRLAKQTVRRLVSQIESAQDAGADVVLVTCSSIGPGVPVARALFDIPILRVDERMAERAVAAGPRIGVLATLSTTLDPTVSLMRDTATARGSNATVTSLVCDGAFQAVISGDTASHDRQVLEGLRELARGVDVVVLAQASMARVLAQLEPGEVSVPVLTSPPLALDQAAEVLAGRA